MRFIRGQWVHHRVYESSGDVSFDGKLVVYHGFNGHRVSGRAGWTAVSRPPFFTALAMWKHEFPGGGGLFTGNRELVVFDSLAAKVEPPLLPSRKLFSVDSCSERLRCRGWISAGENKLPKWPPPWPDGSANFMWTRPWGSEFSLIHNERIGGWMRMEGGRRRIRFKIHRQSTGEEFPLERADWADVDHRDRLAFTRDGKLYVMELQKGALCERMLADFTEDLPQPAEPPAWALRWPR